MFGSKNKKETKKQVGISVKTMDSDLKGEGSKKMAVEYEEVHLNQEKMGDGGEASLTGASSDKTKTPLQSPFGQKESNISSGVANNATQQNIEKSNIPQGTFHSNIGGKMGETPGRPIVENVNNNFSLTDNKSQGVNPGSPATAQGEDKPFLHTATSQLGESGASSLKTDAVSSQVKKKSNPSSIIWVIAFILLLATILLGGYYFYMKSSSQKTDQPQEQVSSNAQQIKKETKPSNTDSDNNTYRGDKIVTEDNVRKTTTSQEIVTNRTPIKKETVAMDKFNTTETTFNNDLKEFVGKLKLNGNELELKNGVFVTPMRDETTPFDAKALLVATHLTEVIDATNLKPACKLFVSSDSGLIRVALVFELKDGVDSKLVKDKIVKNEQVLPAKMQYLFVDGQKPIIPTTIKFSVNPNNYDSRYFNYSPPSVISSVDWNILDLGKGKIIYFATSKSLAEKITSYFMRTVAK